MFRIYENKQVFGYRLYANGNRPLRQLLGHGRTCRALFQRQQRFPARTTALPELPLCSAKSSGQPRLHGLLPARIAARAAALPDRQSQIFLQYAKPVDRFGLLAIICL